MSSIINLQILNSFVLYSIKYELNFILNNTSLYLYAFLVLHLDSLPASNVGMPNQP